MVRIGRLFRPVKLGKHEDGSISLMAALFLGIILAGAGYALDTGSLRLEKRTAQSAVDLAAIAAASNLDKADAAANGSIAANKISRVLSVVVTKGHYTGDVAVPSSVRFVPNAVPINAVQVRLRKTGKQFFSQLLSAEPMTMEVVGVAATSAEATFSLGSQLSDVTSNTVPNRALTGLLGGNVNLSINNFDALENAQVTVFDFLNGLASALNINTGTYGQLLNSSATVGDVLTAIANAATSNGDTAAAAAVTALKSQSQTSTLSISLNSLISLGDSAQLSIGQQSTGLAASFDALELINGAAKTANAGKQVAIDLNTVIPGLLSLKLDLALGQPPAQSPWVRVGQTEATLYQAASRIRLVAEVGGVGLLTNVRLRIPFYITLGQSRARLDDIACAGGDIQKSSVTIGTLAGAVDAWIGEVPNPAFGNLAVTPTVADATIANVLLLVKIIGKAHVEVGAPLEKPLSFSYDDIQQLRMKSVGTDLGVAIVESLVSSLQLTVTALGLNVVTVKTNVLTSILNVAPAIDGVLHTVLELLGLKIGAADVVVHGVRCDGGVLVN